MNGFLKRAALIFALGFGVLGALAPPDARAAVVVQLLSDDVNCASTVTCNLASTGITAPVGSYNVCIVYVATDTNTISTPSDSGANTWNVTSPVSATTHGRVQMFWSLVTVAMPSGTSTVAAGWSSVDTGLIQCANIQGLSAGALDVVGGGDVGSGTGPFVQTGVLTQANEVIIGATGSHVASGPQTYSEAAGFTNINNDLSSSGKVGAGMGYEIVSSTTSVLYQPTLGVFANYGANVFSFKAPGAAAGASNRALMGVGQ